MMNSIMTEHTTRESFIVRIYRCDSEDARKVTGLVEATDGSGATAPFTNTDELCAILNGFIGKATSKAPKSGKSEIRRRIPGSENKRSGGIL